MPDVLELMEQKEFLDHRVKLVIKDLQVSKVKPVLLVLMEWMDKMVLMEWMDKMEWM